MNAYVQEWIWRFSQATGVAKYIFLAIGRRTKRNARGEFETPPLPVDVIASDTGMVDSTVRKHLKALAENHGELDIVKDARRGEVYRYRLRRQLRIPLDADSPGPAHRRLAAASPPNLGGEVSAESRRSDRSDAAVTAPNGGGELRPDTFSLEDVRTSTSTTATYEQEAADFYEWFCVTFLVKRGFAYVVKREDALDVIRELLRTRSTERLQAMAVLMFDAVRDTFITTSDYSLFVLRHKATYLEGIAVGNDRREVSR